MTLLIRIAFIFFITGATFSKSVIETFDLDQGVGADLYLRAGIIGIAILTLVGLLRMLGVFIINFCLRKTKCKLFFLYRLVKKEKIEKVRGEISIDVSGNLSAFELG